MRKLTTVLKSKYVNVRGFHTDRKIIVIESDDWGSIRTPSKGVLEQLEQVETVTDAFLRYDSLEKYEDIERIICYLSKIKDKNGNSPCITANFAVANPDFDRIDVKNGDYYYEEFTRTYERYGECRDIIGLIKSDEAKGVFLPQLHSLEHLNVIRWMNALKNGEKDVALAFQYRMIGTQRSFSEKNVFGYMDALNYDDDEELAQLEKRLSIAFAVFKEKFGCESSTFVAPCHVWSDSIELILKKYNVQLIQSADWQNDFSRVEGTSRTRRKLHYTGQKNPKSEIYYSVRNCNFEPAVSGCMESSVKDCLRSVRKAFENKKPAIINSHRVNYMSRISEENAVSGCTGLCTVLKNAIKEFNDVEFMSSTQLAELIKKECSG